MASEGSAIDRNLAMRELNWAEDRMALANNDIVTAIGGLEGFQRAIRCQKGTPMYIAYSTFGNALVSVCNEIKELFPGIHKALASLINAGGSVTATVLPYSNKTYKTQTLVLINDSSVSGITNYESAKFYVDFVVGSLRNAGEELDYAVYAYKNLWSIANDSNFSQLGETVHVLADKVRKLAQNINAASKDFGNQVTNFINVTQVEELKSSSEAQEKINSMIAQLNDVNINIAK